MTDREEATGDIFKDLRSNPEVRKDVVKHIKQAQSICHDYFAEGRGDDEYVTKLAHEYLAISAAEITRLKAQVGELKTGCSDAESQIRRGWSKINRSISPNHNVALLDICNGLKKLAALNSKDG